MWADNFLDRDGTNQALQRHRWGGGRNNIKMDLF
jgi:hypothetical protein